MKSKKHCKTCECRLEKIIMCDAPNCEKEAKFQSGMSRTKLVGSWCNDKHFEKYAIFEKNRINV